MYVISISFLSVFFKKKVTSFLFMLTSFLFMSLFFWSEWRDTVASRLACSTTANYVCSTRLAPTSLKSIINRFLNARCPLWVQVPFNLAPKEKRLHFREVFLFWSEWRDIVRITEDSLYSASAELSSQPLFFLSASSHARLVCSVVNALATTCCRYQLSRYPWGSSPFNFTPKSKGTPLM